jgi:hypothetical protein
MKSSIYLLQIALMCLFTSLVAQSPGQNGTKDTNQKQHATSAIFDEIMQTLPADQKAQIDSASVDVKSDSRDVHKNTAAANTSRTVRPSVSESGRDGAVKELPDDVRGKVEKAISEIDLMNQDRQIQFKEYEKKRQGNK